MYRQSSAATAALLGIICLAPSAAAHDGTDDSTRPSLGPASAYAFALPEPGTYRLPPIRAAARGAVLREDGKPSDLATLLRGRITVFSFIYTRCADICPVATMQLARLRELSIQHPELKGKLRLISMSFDPDHDTPSVMAEYGLSWRQANDGGAEWLFLTARDRAALGGILVTYDQAVAIAPKAVLHDPAGGLSHVLRVFLVDKAGLIRNIYSMDFLDPELVLTDIRTLIGESAGN